MSNSDWITIWGIAITLFVTTIGSALLLSFRVGGLHNQVMSMSKTLDNVVDDVAWLKVVVAQLVVKVDVLWAEHLSKSNSPIVLNDEGVRLLESSQMDVFADHYYDDILSKVRSARPENAYQAQEALIVVLSEYRNSDECKLKLQEAAFSSGADVTSLLFVAALSIRDRVISELGFGMKVG